MISLAWILPPIFWLIALIHIYWGLGFVWPAASQTNLARTVVGSRGITRMPSLAASIAVALILFVVGSWSLFAVGALPPYFPGWLLVLAGLAFALILLLRGIAAYVGLWRRLTPEEPFATLDRRVYGPLCIALALGIIAVLAGDLV